MVTIEVHSHVKPKCLTIIAKQNGKQLLKSPMMCKTMTQKTIESQIRKDLKIYDTPLYGGISIVYFVKIGDK
jgi:hypothetical protein